MMSIIDDRLNSFFSDVNNNIKGLETKLERLDALSGSIEGKKGGFKEILNRLDSSTLGEEGNDASPKTLNTMKHRLLDSKPACSPV